MLREREMGCVWGGASSQDTVTQWRHYSGRQQRAVVYTAIYMVNGPFRMPIRQPSFLSQLGWEVSTVVPPVASRLCTLLSREYY